MVPRTFHQTASASAEGPGPSGPWLVADLALRDGLCGGEHTGCSRQEPIQALVSLVMRPGAFTSDC